MGSGRRWQLLAVRSRRNLALFHGDSKAGEEEYGPAVAQVTIEMALFEKRGTGAILAGSSEGQPVSEVHKTCSGCGQKPLARARPGRTGGGQG